MARFYVDSHAEGVTLDHPGEDRQWLHSLIAGSKPDLVVLGPIYKMIEGEANEETPNRELVKWLDRLRGEFQFVIALEAHTPHGANRPYGWSGWKRWPEFGFHLTEDGKLERWRGDRDARAWPAQLSKGVPGGWLWRVAVPAVPERPSDPHEERIVEAQMEVLRAMRRADQPLTKPEVLERVSRRRASAVVGFNRLRDQGAFVLTTGERTDARGRKYAQELFEINPHGPFAADDATRSRNTRPPTPGTSVRPSLEGEKPW
jgi:hypothetical protein